MVADTFEALRAAGWRVRIDEDGQGVYVHLDRGGVLVLGHGISLERAMDHAARGAGLV